MTDGQSREDVRFSTLVVLLMLSTAFTGCLNAPDEGCEEVDCFPLESDALSELLSSPGAFDVLALATIHDSLKIETTTTYENMGQFAEIHWDVSKITSSQIRSISMRMTLGTSTIENQVIEGQKMTNIRVNGDWYEGRDEVPDYADPFYEMAQLALEQPDGFWPPFAFDTSAVADLDWLISGDLTSTQQVATANNDTHTIIIELMGTPPMITGIETYSGDEETFRLKVMTGDSVSIQLQEGLPRIAIDFSISNPIQSADGITSWSGYVPSGFTSEVNPAELSFHAISTDGGEETTLSEFNLADNVLNQTDGNGDWWEFIFWDYSGDGYFSASDYYEIRTNSSYTVEIRTFDIWADSWTGQTP